MFSSWTGPNVSNLKGKHVVVVGGSSGIGLAISELALLEGGHVTLIARNLAKLQDAQARLLDALRREVPTPSMDFTARGESGSRSSVPVRCFPADVSGAEEAASAIKAAVECQGPIDILVCCQGVSTPYTFEESSMDTLHQLMDVNYWGSVNAVKASIPSLKAAGSRGRILFVSSQAGQTGVYGYSGYAAAKFALRGLAECLQQELLPYGTRVCIIFPPDTDTPQLHEENKTKPEITKLIAASSSTKPQDARQVARAALKGVKRGDFFISCNFDGFMLNIATAGMAPCRSLGQLMLEVLLLAIVRIIAVATLSNFNAIVLKHHPSRRLSPKG